MLLILLVLAYFVGTSGAFLKSVVLPRVGKAMNATVTVDDLSLSPFSSVSIKGLKVATQGDTPLLTAAEIQVRYSLVDILGGKLTLHELRVESPMIQIVPTADGKDNLAPLLANPTPTKPSTESKPAMKLIKPPQRANATHAPRAARSGRLAPRFWLTTAIAALPKALPPR